MRALALLVLFLFSATASAGESAPQAVLNRMLAAYEAGRIDAPDFYSATSADVQAYYLMAYAWNQALPLEHRRKQAEKLFLESVPELMTLARCGG